MHSQTRTTGRVTELAAAAGAALALCTLSATAEVPRVFGLRAVPLDLNIAPHDVSGDGRVVVGTATSGGGPDVAFFHTDTDQMRLVNGLHSDEYLGLVALTLDGGMAVGSSWRPDQSYRAMYYLPQTGEFGWILGEDSDALESRGIDVSGDARWILGSRYPAPSGPEQAFVLDRNTGELHLFEHPTDDQFGVAATAIAASAPVFVGYLWSDAGPVAFRWSLGAGPEELPSPEGYPPTSDAYAVSADGSVVAGIVYHPDGGVEAVRWVDGEPEPLGRLPGCSASRPSGVSGDGSVVVGECHDDQGNVIAFIWTPETGMRALRDVLVDAGADVGALTFEYVNNISHNGRVIVGDGLVGNVIIPWKVELGDVLDEPPCPADVDGDGEATVNDLLQYLGAFRSGC